MGRDAPTEEKRRQDDTTLKIMSTLFALQSEENKKAMVITGQNTTEILFKYIFYTSNKKTLGVLLGNNFAEELLV